jgi:hypothetical protein
MWVHFIFWLTHKKRESPGAVVTKELRWSVSSCFRRCVSLFPSQTRGSAVLTGTQQSGCAVHLAICCSDSAHTVVTWSHRLQWLRHFRLSQLGYCPRRRSGMWRRVLGRMACYLSKDRGDSIFKAEAARVHSLRLIGCWRRRCESLSRRRQRTRRHVPEDVESCTVI